MLRARCISWQAWSWDVDEKCSEHQQSSVLVFVRHKSYDFSNILQSNARLSHFFFFIAWATTESHESILARMSDSLKRWYSFWSSSSTLVPPNSGRRTWSPTFTPIAMVLPSWKGQSVIISKIVQKRFLMFLMFVENFSHNSIESVSDKDKQFMTRFWCYSTWTPARFTKLEWTGAGTV